jgi:hypothetical protein
MLDWLVKNSDFLGVHAQNWMLLFAGLFALYVAWLAIGRHAL